MKAKAPVMYKQEPAARSMNQSRTWSSSGDKMNRYGTVPGWKARKSRNRCLLPDLTDERQATWKEKGAPTMSTNKENEKHLKTAIKYHIFS